MFGLCKPSFRAASELCEPVSFFLRESRKSGGPRGRPPRASAMHKRRSHTKSRKGCTNCKKRHVKCDEQGPPCAACMARGTTDTCAYQTKPSDARSEGQARSATTTTTTTTTPSATDAESSSRSDGPQMEESEARRLLELRLMHRWMTHTWKCMHGLDEDAEFLIEQLPQASLRYEYLLYGTLALCAADLAIHGEQTTLRARGPSFYLATAMSYYDLASQALRPQLAKQDADAHVWVYMTTVMLTTLQMAIAQCLEARGGREPRPSMIERLGLIIDLSAGSGSVALSDSFSLFSGAGGSMMQRAAELLGGPPPPCVEPALQAVIDHLHAVVSDPSAPDAEPLAPQYRPCYALVARLLELSVREESRRQIRGTCVSVPMYCGRDFYAAVTSSQPTALFLLIIFGALVEIGARDGFWWANHFGPGLVQESCLAMASAYPDCMRRPHWREGIAWARAEAGLPPLAL
ncbi:uncharacterized protein PV09_02211 [Verruconis gallopava]|uniref:Zn(2)-C6 fungal-type domain-containing protein n=1 Tax=Verruconis gallopava TaxID=253628 RepID=A0A0D2ALH8_9PEZI|nr:uncharacterized protein PV09_02211 [Verruconis gallopava]KIW07365.1 hypothetical protein PV09_02211 [Verruconis gallopava]